MIARIGPWFALVRFSHSVFALPFALTSAWIAAGGMPAPRTLLLLVLAAVAARSAAMGFNRWIDREIDARNPRTAGREIPRGVLAPGAVLVFVAASAAVFVACSFLLAPLCGWLSLPVLCVLGAYSLFKRFHAGGHFALGLALALAPLGAWLAVRGELSGDLAIPLLLAAAVLTWVAGFDLIYSCQDRAVDVEQGLHSIPARFGVARALALSSWLHVSTVALLCVFAWRAGLGGIFLVALALAALLLFWQHRMVSAQDLSRVNLAFFTLNGWVGVGLFGGTVLDLYLHAGSTVP